MSATRTKDGKTVSTKGMVDERTGSGNSPELSRRSLVTAASWSVPAVVMMSASPAFALSGTLNLALTVPNGTVPAAGSTSISAKVTDSTGAPVAGQAVSFSGATFSPPTPVTNGSGVAVTSLITSDRWMKPGTTIALSATAGSQTVSATATVLGANLVVAGSSYSANISQAELQFRSPIREVVAGEAFFVVLLEDGSVWAKGQNQYGQLGDGTTDGRSLWKQVTGLSSGVTQIAAGGYSAYALLSDGSVKAWGINFNGELGIGSTAGQSTPVTVTGLPSSVSMLGSGMSTVYALLSDGSVMAWGSSSSGQIGDGGTSNRKTPVPLTALSSGVVHVAGGKWSGYAVMADGSARAWGYNASAQLGDGTTANRPTPVTPTGLGSSVTSIAAGEGMAYALLSDGSVMSWGDNYNGQLGTGTTAGESSTAVVVPGLSSGVAQIAASSDSGHALLASGAVKAWGWNSEGQLGDGTGRNRSTPVTVSMPDPDGRPVTHLARNSPTAKTSFFVTSTS